MISAATDRTSLLALLAPVLERVAALGPEERAEPAAAAALEAALAESFAIDGELVAAIGASLERGVAEGWLCDRGEEDARFSRVARPSPETHDLSIDVVRLAGAGLRHRHPKGEVTLGFAVEGAPRFCGRPPGWVFAAPGSVHVPEVNDGRMNLIYFLPNAAVEWDPAPESGA